jgi:hypothetical protein
MRPLSMTLCRSLYGMVGNIDTNRTNVSTEQRIQERVAAAAAASGAMRFR